MPAAGNARRFRRILGTIVLLCVCLLAFLTVLVPFLLGAQSYTVLTGSMRPTLEPGHLIAVRDTPIKDIRVGDVITFQLESGKPTVATHRVVSVGHSAQGERLLYTQGDANNLQDENSVQEAQIRGVLVYAIPWLGYLNVWATPLVKSLLITIVGIGAIGWGLLVLLSDARRRRRIAQAGVVAAVACLLIALPLPAPTAHASTASQLLLSADGIDWTTDGELPLVNASDLIVPGEEHTIVLWVRNASEDSAEFSVSGAWSPADWAEPADVALAAGLIAPDPDGSALKGGEITQVPLTIALAPSAENDTRGASATLTMTITLTQAEPADGTNPLAPTGTDAPVALVVTASVLVAAGLLLLMLRLIVRRRRNRHDQ